MGHKLLINSRQNLDPTNFQKIVGEQPDVEQLYAQYSSSAIQLIGQSDFFVFDGTLPSEKAFLAQSIQELAGVLMQTGLHVEMGIDIKKLIEEIYALRGLTSLQRFQMTPEEQTQAMIQQQVQAALQSQLQSSNGNAQNQPSSRPDSTAGRKPQPSSR